jgi:predicted negative regulator of RcsB-dependent stress response
MAAYDLEEQEQLAELKLWWKRYGNMVVLAVSFALILVAAWSGWKIWQHNQSQHASAAYSDLQKAARENDVKKVGELTGTILEQFPRTAYAPLAALISAKVHFESGDLKTAKAQLQWVVSNARDGELQDIARLRLSGVLVDEKAFDEALKTLDTKPSSHMEPLFSGARGDVMLAQGKVSDARAAFKSALEKTPAKQVAARELLQLKIESTGGVK